MIGSETMADLHIYKGTKVRVAKVIDDTWLDDIFNKRTRKRKTDYEGQVGIVINHPMHLYDVLFSDGAVWCFEYSELEVIR